MCVPRTAVKRSSWMVPLLVLSLSTIAYAALGNDENSIQADQAHIRASARVTRTAIYAVHELQAPSGHVVREYVSPAGQVFAVGWVRRANPEDSAHPGAV